MHARRLLALAFVAVSAFVQVHDALAVETWTITGGRSTFNFQANRLRGIGISLDQVDLTATAPDPILMDIEPPYWNWAISPETDFQFSVENDHLASREFWSGSVAFRGGLTFRDLSGASIEFRDWVMDFVPPRGDGPGGEKEPSIFFARLSSAQSPYLFEFEDEMPIFLRDAKRLVIYGSVKLTPEFAHRIGHDALADEIIGRVEVAADVEYVSGVSTEPPYVPHFADGQTLSFLDVSLGALASPVEYGRVGTFPNGTSGISMATTSCNLGDVDVHWYAPMNPDHPGIAMAVYREKNGRLEQIGASYIKHGFFALSNSDCTPCLHPSGGSFLGVGCSDTYSTANNADRTYLGPRREWNPYTAGWTCTGSHFSGGVADCTRRHGGSGHDDVQHRVETPDSTMTDSTATYYYEANYLIAGDQATHNNVGSRKFTARWMGTFWLLRNVTSANPLVEGPVIERWGDMRGETDMGTGDGKVILGVKVTNPSPGIYSYEYALYNLSSYREVQSITFPVGAATVTNVGFHDWDKFPANDWTWTLSGGMLTFQTTPFATDSTANALTFGLLDNFRFQCDSPPSAGPTGYASLTPWRPGAPGSPPRIFILLPTSATSVPDVATAQEIRLGAPMPNPLNPSTTIRFELATEADATLEIFGAQGRRVTTLHSGPLSAGAHAMAWDGTDSGGSRVAPGVYYYRLTAGKESAAQSLVVIR